VLMIASISKNMNLAIARLANATVMIKKHLRVANKIK
jgi:hypothetical protein